VADCGVICGQLVTTAISQCPAPYTKQCVSFSETRDGAQATFSFCCDKDELVTGCRQGSVTGACGLTTPPNPDGLSCDGIGFRCDCTGIEITCGAAPTPTPTPTSTATPTPTPNPPGPGPTATPTAVVGSGVPEVRLRS
jgi:hypothetical protein